MPSHDHPERGIAATLRVIDAAADEHMLRAGVQRAREAVIIALNAHTPTLTLAAAWSEVLRQSVATAARLAADGRALRWTWFVSGSVARGEAIPGSDLETLISLDDDVTEDEKAEALQLAAAAHGLLEGCGLPMDANGVLASRGRFCRRHASWIEGIERWCADPEHDRGVVMTGLLADATGVRDRAGDNEIRMRTIEAARRHPAAGRAMLQDATTSRSAIPSRLKIFTTHDDSADLKLAAVDPIVKIARWAALSVGSNALATLDRLNDAAAGKALDADDASSLRDCYQRLSRIRWRTRAGSWIDGRPVDERVSLSELGPADRAALRTIAREVNGIRRKLIYLASTPSFR